MKHFVLLIVFLALFGCKEADSNDVVLPDPEPAPAVVIPAPEYVNWGEEFVKYALTYDGIQETFGPNSSPIIDQFQAYSGFDPKAGAPWCAMFTNWVQGKTLEKYDLKLHYKSARVSWIRKYALKNKYLYKIKFAKGLIYGIDTAEEGDQIIWLSGFSNELYPDLPGHTGLIISETSPGKFKTIEGNTGPGEAGSQRDGDGVYVRDRSINLISKFHIDMLITPIYPEVEK